MSKLYEINQEVARIQERVEWDGEQYVDLDTGEIMTEEELEELFQSLDMDKHEILVWMAKCIINDRSEADAIKAEEKRLAERRKAKEKRIERFMAIIDRECAGKKTDLEIATFSYRKSEAVVWDDKDAPDIICWLEEHGHDDCLKYQEPEIRKDPLKQLINSGVHVPLAMVEKRNKGNLK